MFNPIDTKQIRSLIEYRREHVASDAYRVQKAAEAPQPNVRRVTRVRIAIGTGLIRAGERVAGMYAGDLPSFRPGV